MCRELQFAWQTSMRVVPFALAFAGMALSQTGGPTTIRSTTRLVQVNVLAHDKNGPVAGLKQEDFVLMDGKKQRKIATFAMDTSTSTIPGAMPKLPPNVFTNSLQRHSATPTSVTVILFDSLNTPITDQVYARLQVGKFLGTLHPEERVAIYSLGRDVTILHDFTDDHEELARVIAHYRGRTDAPSDGGPGIELPGANVAQRELPSSEDEAFNAKLSSFMRMIAMAEVTNRVQLTVHALEAIANHLAPLPGRKNLVWISASFPFSFGYYGPEGMAKPASTEHAIYRDEIERAARALNRANIAIYPVDARGLMVGQGYQASLSLILGTGANMNQLTSWLAAINLAQDTMEDLANRTGGKAYYNTNDIAGSVRRAIDDTQVSYTLGFYADDADLDGKYHELRVRVASRKGVEIRARQGYYAGDRAPVTSAAIDGALRQAVSSSLQSAQIEIGVHVTRDSPEPNSLRLDLLVSPRELTLALKDERWQGAIRLSVVQLDAEGKALDLATDPIKLNLKKESMPEYWQTGMSMAKTLKAKPGLKQLRVIVVDRDSGVAGSVIVPMARVT